MCAIRKRSPVVPYTYVVHGAVFLVVLCLLDVAFGWVPILDRQIFDFTDHDDPERKVNVWIMEDTYCPLDVMGVYPYLVGIRSTRVSASGYYRHGVILSHLAVLSSANGGLDAKAIFYVQAQRVFQMTGKTYKMCFQTRTVDQVIRHPKWNGDPPPQEHFPYEYSHDFIIFTLDSQFDATPDFVYPVVPLHRNPYEYVMFLRKVANDHGASPGCELPNFDRRSPSYPIIGYTDTNKIHEPHSECISSFCSKFIHPETCKQVHQKEKNYTLVCVEFGKIQKKADPGSPLVCNGSLVGLAYESPNPFKWVMVVSLIKVWPWLMTYKHYLWNDTWNREDWDTPYIEDHKLYFNKINKAIPNKNVSSNARKVVLIEPRPGLRRRRSHAGHRISYDFFMFYSTAVLMIMISYYYF